MTCPTLDKAYWTHGYVLLSKEVEDCVPAFLKHVAQDVYVCGKTVNLLKLCCPRVSRPQPADPRPVPVPSGLWEPRSRSVILCAPLAWPPVLSCGSAVLERGSWCPESFTRGSCIWSSVQKWQEKRRCFRGRGAVGPPSLPSSSVQETPQGAGAGLRLQEGGPRLV